MNEEYLYVLDFGNRTLNVIHLYEGDKKPEDFTCSEELLKYWGFNPDTCNYMYSEDELELNHITEPLLH